MMSFWTLNFCRFWPIMQIRKKGGWNLKKIFSSETTEPISTKFCWNDSWMAPFQNCVRWSRLPTKMAAKLKIEKGGMKFLAHLAFRPCELLSSLFVRRLSSVVRRLSSVVRRPSSVVYPSTFHILIFSSETTGPIATKLWWNDSWMAPFQNCVRWSRLPTKMAAKLKIEKGGMKF